MPLRLIEVTTDAQFEKMMPSFWRAFKDPRDVLRELMFPVKGDGPDAVAKAIEDAKNRFLAGWHANPVGHYIQILDEDDNNAVVASALWNFYDEEHNPYMNSGKGDSAEKVPWWPKDSEIRKYVIMLIDAGLVPQLQRQNKPHFYIGMLYTDPSYRRRGAAAMMTDWGMKKADELGVECFLTVNENAVPFYRRSGFCVVDRTPLDIIDNSSQEWKELQRKYPLPMQINMWRPVGGKYKEGEKYPWED